MHPGFCEALFANSNAFANGKCCTKREPFTGLKIETCESINFIVLAREVASQSTEGRGGQEEIAKGVPAQDWGW